MATATTVELLSFRVRLFTSAAHERPLSPVTCHLLLVPSRAAPKSRRAFSPFLDEKKSGVCFAFNAESKTHMNLETARNHIRTCRERMDALYQKSVFDEWVVLSLTTAGAKILWYEGPRPGTFEKDLHRDSAALVSEMADKKYEIGDFEFAQEAEGSSFDAGIRLGEILYLLCNNTTGTLADLRRDPRWRQAQKPFVDLTEKFRADPLE